MTSAQLISASTPLLVSGWNVGVGERGVCTLLGPEGPGRPLVEPNLLALTSVGLVPSGVGDRPYFENYTVDASILKKNFCRSFPGPVELM